MRNPDHPTLFMRVSTRQNRWRPPGDLATKQYGSKLSESGQPRLRRVLHHINTSLLHPQITTSQGQKLNRIESKIHKT